MADNPPSAVARVCIYLRALFRFQPRAFQNPASVVRLHRCRAACLRAHPNFVGRITFHCIMAPWPMLCMRIRRGDNLCKGAIQSLSTSTNIHQHPQRSSTRRHEVKSCSTSSKPDVWTWLSGCVKRIRKGPIACDRDSLTYTAFLSCRQHPAGSSTHIPARPRSYRPLWPSADSCTGHSLPAIPSSACQWHMESRQPDP